MNDNILTVLYVPDSSKKGIVTGIKDGMEMPQPFLFCPQMIDDVMVNALDNKDKAVYKLSYGQ